MSLKKSEFTPGQEAVIRNLGARRSVSHGIRGMSAFGGLERTLWSLGRLGIMDRMEMKLTKRGREAHARIVGGKRDPERLTATMQMLLDSASKKSEIQLRGRGQCVAAQALERRGYGKYTAASWPERSASFRKSDL